MEKFSCNPRCMVYLKRNDIEYCCNQIGEELKEIQEMPGRRLVSNIYTHSSMLFIVKTNRKTYVLKNISADLNEAKLIVKIAIELRKYIPIVSIKHLNQLNKNLGSYIICKSGYYHVFSEFLQNESYCSKKYTFGKLRAIAKALAKADTFLWDFSKENLPMCSALKHQPLCHLLISDKEVLVRNKHQELLLKEKLSDIENLFMFNYEKVINSLSICKANLRLWGELPQRVLFYDLNISNAVFDEMDNLVGIFDFDTLRYGPRILEFKNAIITAGQDARFIFNTFSLVEFIRSYSEIKKLENDEMALLPIMFLGAFCDIFFDFFFGKWNLFNNGNHNELYNCALSSLKNMNRAYYLGFFFASQDFNKLVIREPKYSLSIKFKRLIKYFAPTLVEKHKGIPTLKYFFVYDVLFSSGAERRIKSFISFESEREEYERMLIPDWKLLSRFEREKRLRFGGGPAQLNSLRV